MKSFKKLAALCAVGTAMTFASCGGDNCEQVDWVGRYSTTTTVCTTSTNIIITLNPSFDIVAGNSANTIQFNGIDRNINDCTVSFEQDSLQWEFELDGSNLAVSIEDCVFNFSKN